MCLWILSACLGMAALRIPYPYRSSIVTGGPAPPPVVLPPLPPVVTTTTARPFTLPGGTLPPFPSAPTLVTTTTARPNVLPPLPPAPLVPAITTLPPMTTKASIIDPRFGVLPPLKMYEVESLLRFGDGENVDTHYEPNPGPDVVIFPRTKRAVVKPVRENKVQATNCACVVPAKCPIVKKSDAVIDFRVINEPLNATCPPGLRWCCGATSAAQLSCGSRLLSPSTYPIQLGQARYGDYPWMVVIMTTDNRYIGGGTLIDTQNVITTAHRISAFPNGVGLKIRVAEWDMAGTYEQYPFKDINISRVWTHEAFNPNTLQNDLSLIRLAGGIPAGTPGVVPVCLPTAGQVFDGMRCWVSGWGQDAFGPNGRLQTILKAVDVPIIPAASCETNLRTTRLGTAYMLDRTAFLCAGAELNKDSCTGDGGSGLVCETSGRWTVAGLVAWGIGCASQGVPAAYVNIVNYLPWIQARQSMAA